MGRDDNADLPELVHLTPTDSRRVRWKNGRGVTEELAIGPVGASFERADHDWRISKAAVDEDGPFSVFEGFDRVLVVTAGNGLRLSHDDGVPHLVRSLEPYRFDGGGATRAELVGGPIRDFNVLTRRGRVAAEVRVAAIDFAAFEVPLAAGASFLHILTGSVVVSVGDTEVRVGAGESALVRGARSGDELGVRSHAATVIAVSLREGA